MYPADEWFQQKLENHRAAVALWVSFYNLCRVHETLRCTPAMALGVVDHIWTIAELVSAALAPSDVPPLPRPTPETTLKARICAVQASRNPRRKDEQATLESPSYFRTRFLSLSRLFCCWLGKGLISKNGSSASTVACGTNLVVFAVAETVSV